jgi:BirA family transcriptional regulator, biotin operon repressor / biotin---[acetyl-CoA-carboxylase] ligase
MRDELLKTLTEQPDTIVSGRDLSDRFGVSRVTIWKHIRKLREMGYPISTSPRGYRLETAADDLLPGRFPGRSDRIHYFERLDSTMDQAKRMAREGCPDFTVVIAGRQERGRGRLNRQWHSGPGGLYFTVVLRPNIAPVAMSRVTFAASVSLARVLRRDFGIEVCVKWPNDLLVAEKKLSGMLCEMDVVDDRVGFLNVGIGLNVNNDPSRLEPGATSLRKLLKRKLSRRHILTAYLDTLEQALTPERLPQAITDWKAMTGTLNRSVRIVTTQETVAGRAIDIDDSGALLVELPDRTVRQVFLGDCFHQAD